MKIIISGKTYDGSRTATLADLIALERTVGVSRAEFADLDRAMRDATPEERMNLDGALLYVGIVVWITRRRNGETSLTLEQACDFPIDELEFVSEPGDQLALGDAAAPIGGSTPDPLEAARASARAAAAAPAHDGEAASARPKRKSSSKRS